MGAQIFSVTRGSMKRNSLLGVLFVSLAIAMQALPGIPGRTIAQSNQIKPASAQNAAVTPGSVAAIVELESEPVVRHQRLTEQSSRRVIDFESQSARAYESVLENEHANFKSRAMLVSPSFRIRTELRRLSNAISIEATPSELSAIAVMPGVKSVEIVKKCFATTDVSVPLINASALWDRLGGPSTAGQGMRIAILDTGIDITNPLFSDSGFTAPAGFPRATRGNESLVNNKVIVAKAFLPGGNTSALDENGHGTNCAGIAAGVSGTMSPIGGLSGVAPRAYLGNYRVLGRSGGGDTDLIAKGLDEAVTVDKFDVVSMSLGSLELPTGSGFLEDMVQHAVDSGAVVVVAAGNNETPETIGQPMTIRSPGIASAAITVGASSNSHLAGPRETAIVSVPGTDDASLVSVNAPRGNGAVNPPALDGALGPLPYVDVSTLDGGNRGCGTFPPGSLSGKVALIERGNNCSFAQKVNNANAAGARAVIIYNKDVSEGSDGGETLFAFAVDDTRILSVLVKRSTGLALRSWLQAHAGAQVTITPEPFGQVSVPADVLATFSAIGPSVLEELKPDVSAPGINIYSGAIKNGPAVGVVDPSGFQSVSGTSQATPHVAGAAALIKQLNPSFSPQQIKSVLISSATTDVFTSVDKTTRAGVLATGGGRIDLARASSVNATISPASMGLGIYKLKKKNVTISVDLNVTNQTGAQGSYSIGVEQLDPGDGVTVTTSTDNLTVAGGQTLPVTITIFALKTSERRDYTGYIRVTRDGQTLRVPYWVRYVKKRA